MMGASLLYRSALRVLRLSAPALARGHSKVARGLQGRRNAAASLTAWAEGHRDPALPAAWFHAPSVGEGLQARAVLEALAARRGDLQSVFTHFSPSAETLAADMPVAWAGYLPWDLPEEVGPVLDALRPGVVAFTKTEVWPTLVAQAARRSVPVAMVAGAVPPGAGRMRWSARTLLRSTWARLALVAAVDQEDASAFRTLGVPADVIHVTGDPGMDAALARARSARPDAPHLRPFADGERPTLVAGSVWPADLRVLVPALQALRREVPDLRVVVVPHEPTHAAVAGLLDVFAGLGWSSKTLAEVEREGVGGVDAVVVERVGVLSSLYTVAQAAYIGGGFHAAGVHSVLEPAAAGVPMAFGPKHSNARAAGHLLAARAGRAVADDKDLARVLHPWLTDPGARDYAGRQARGYIDAHQGAGDRTAALLAHILT